jgi:hypothetical protein
MLFFFLLFMACGTSTTFLVLILLDRQQNKKKKKKKNGFVYSSQLIMVYFFVFLLRCRPFLFYRKWEGLKILPWIKSFLFFVRFPAPHLKKPTKTKQNSQMFRIFNSPRPSLVYQWAYFLPIDSHSNTPLLVISFTLLHPLLVAF